MEKLQKALAKAREKRAASPPAQPRVGGVAQRPADSVDPAWASLTEFRPKQAVLKKNRVVSMVASSSSTHFDVLRTKVLLQMRQHGWKRLAITSPSPGCGKTTTACNLIGGFSRQAEIRSILFDLDLRRPGVGKLFGHQPERSVDEVLAGKVDFAEQAVRLGQTAAISAARRSISDPTRLLMSDNTPTILNQIDATYAPDVMLFDLPPFLHGDDTRAFLTNADCALIVARAEDTTIGQIDLCEREIAEHTNVLGVVLNQCRHSDESYGGYGYDTY